MTSLLLFIIGILVGIVATILHYDKGEASAEYRPLPHYVPSGPTSSWSVEIAGINYRDGIGDYVTRGGQWREARLVDEPTNEYDQNAIRIEDMLTGHHLGYVPRNATFAVRTWTRRYRHYTCLYDIRLEHDDEGKGYFYGHIYLNVKYEKIDCNAAVAAGHDGRLLES